MDNSFFVTYLLLFHLSMQHFHHHLGTIQRWNDSLIQRANMKFRNCLPSSLITVVAMKIPSDTDSIFIRYLTLISPEFKAIYTADRAVFRYNFFDFSKLIPASRCVFMLISITFTIICQFIHAGSFFLHLCKCRIEFFTPLVIIRSRKHYHYH